MHSTNQQLVSSCSVIGSKAQSRKQRGMQEAKPRSGMDGESHLFVTTLQDRMWHHGNDEHAWSPCTGHDSLPWTPGKLFHWTLTIICKLSIYLHGVAVKNQQSENLHSSVAAWVSTRSRWEIWLVPSPLDFPLGLVNHLKKSDPNHLSPRREFWNL